MTKNDLRDLRDFNSLERTIYRDLGVIDFRNYDLNHFDYEGFEIDRFKLPSYEGKEASPEERKEKVARVDKFVDSFVPISSKKKIQVKQSLQELIRNAQKHGNNLDSSKKIGVGYMLKLNSLHLFVEDEGGVIDSNLLPYTRYLESCIETNEDFGKWELFHTQFCKKENPEGNGGQGTKIVHGFSDSVGYFKSELGGLLVKTRYDF